MKPARIAPSILAADFARLASEVAAVEPHVDLLHIDVMDGHFVPNLSLGIPVIRSLRPHTSLRFDCHMMTTNPHAYFAPLKKAGCDIVTVHIEVFPEPGEAAAAARAEGLQFGLVLNPPTPFEAVEPFVELCDMIVLMSVHPGFGGQGFIDGTLAKIEAVRNFVDSRAIPADIEVDGGIGPDNIRRAREAGADVFVAGSSIFRADDPVAAVAAMRDELEVNDRP
ncbi:MAG: ribulose-phosphate 3-epimerase [Acidimicrobiia bacterium]